MVPTAERQRTSIAWFLIAQRAHLCEHGTPIVRIACKHIEVAEHIEPHPGSTERDEQSVLGFHEAELVVQVGTHQGEEHDVVLLALVVVHHGDTQILELCARQSLGQLEPLPTVHREHRDARRLITCIGFRINGNMETVVQKLPHTQVPH